MTPEMMQQFPFLMGVAQPQAQGQPTPPQTEEMQLGGGISAAPQAVSAPAGATGGSGHSGTTQNPNLQQRWQSYMTHPATTAMLLAMGIEMMKPRWEPMSALPDALSSGVRAQGAFYEDEQKRADAERDFNRETAAQDEKEERATERTRIAASSREDIARANNAARWERENFKASLKASPQTKEERLFYRQTYLQRKSQLESQNKDARDELNKKLNPNLKEMTPQEIDAQAKEAAQRALQNYRLEFDGAGGGGDGGHMQQNTQQGTSGNSSTPPPTGGNTAVPHAGGNAANNVANTPQNPEEYSPQDMTIAELEKRTPGIIAEAVRNPERLRKLQRILTPEEYQKALTGQGPMQSKFGQGYVGR